MRSFSTPPFRDKGETGTTPQTAKETKMNADRNLTPEQIEIVRLALSDFHGQALYVIPEVLEYNGQEAADEHAKYADEVGVVLELFTNQNSTIGK